MELNCLDSIAVMRVSSGERGRLRIGFVSLADFGVLPQLLKAYKAARPGVQLALREMLSPEQSLALAAGELDFGLLLPPVAEGEGLEHVVVQREHFERDRGAMTGRFVKGHPVTAIQTLAGGATPRVVHESWRMARAPMLRKWARSIQERRD